MAKILAITTNYWPEPTGIAVYLTDLAETLQNHDHAVFVLTTLPHYPWWKTPSEYTYIREGAGIHNDVDLIRVKHLIPSKINAFMRIRFELSLLWNLLRGSKKLMERDFDLVISCIPTVASGLVGRKIAKELGVPFAVIVQDLSGVGAKQSGLRGGALISKAALAVEESVLRAAESIVVVSPAMRDVLLNLGIDSTRISQITNYCARNINHLDNDLARAEFAWPDDEFIVIHTGNMGAKQGLENVVEAAKVLGTNTKIKIYLVGHGNQEANLKKLCEGLEHIRVMGAVPDNLYSALLSAADLLLINERSTQMEMSLPSKLTSYLYSERPVLASVPRGGATWKFLDGVAELVDAGDPTALAKKIVELSNNPARLSDLARRGKTFAENHLNPDVGRKKYLNWVESLVKLKNNE